MTSAQQKQLQNLKSALPKILSSLASRYKMKKSGGSLFCVKGGLFFDCVIALSATDGGDILCMARERLKPLWLDDLLWQLLGMEENRTAPLSLRATGAFSVSGVRIHEDKKILFAPSEIELEKAADEQVAHFFQSVQKSTIADFTKNLSQPYHNEVRNALWHIHEGQFQKAMESVGASGEGVFKNGRIDINDAIRSCCARKIADCSGGTNGASADDTRLV